MGEPLSPATVSVQRARALRRRMDERVRREGDRGMRVGRVSGLRIHSDRGLRKGEEKTGTLGGNGGGDWGVGARMEIEKARKKKGRPSQENLGQKTCGKNAMVRNLRMKCLGLFRRPYSPHKPLNEWRYASNCDADKMTTRERRRE